MLYTAFLWRAFPIAFGLTSLVLLVSGKPEWWVVGLAGAGSGFVLWLVGAGLKTVRFDGTTLHIADRKRSIEIPIADVVSVHQGLFFRPRVVTLTIRHETPFGRWIRFLPLWTLSVGKEYPIVGELRRAAAHANESG